MESKPGLHVFLGRDFQVDGFAFDVALVQVPQEGHAPLAACACAEAFADEGRDGRVFSGEKALDLPQGDMEAEADFVVLVHAIILCRARDRDGLVRAIAEHQLPEAHVVPLVELVPGVLEGADEGEAE